MTMAGYFSADCSLFWEVKVADQFGLNGRTRTFLPSTMRIRNADRYQAQTWTISANLSAQAITLTPLGVSAPGALLLFLADQPVDVRWNAASDTIFLSSVRQMSLAANFSNLFVTTGSYATVLHLEVTGGSNATVTMSLPLP